MATPTKSAARKKKIKRNVATGQVHIKATFNNTIISVTDEKGGVIAWSTSGAAGFKGSRKSTPYAASIASEQVAAKAKEAGMKTCEVFVQGVGSGRDSAIRALTSSGINISSIKDVTGIPHNGCRPRKPRKG